MENNFIDTPSLCLFYKESPTYFNKKSITYHIITTLDITIFQTFIPIQSFEDSSIKTCSGELVLAMNDKEHAILIIIFCLLAQSLKYLDKNMYSACTSMIETTPPNGQVPN